MFNLSQQLLQQLFELFLLDLLKVLQKSIQRSSI